MSLPAGLPPGVETLLEKTIGVTLQGSLVNTLFFGMNTVQAFAYFQQLRGRDDGNWTKLLVGFLWVLNALTIIFTSVYLNDILIHGFTNVEGTDVYNWSVPAQVVITVLNNFVVKCFFVWRLWLVSRGLWVVTSVAALLAVMGFGFGLGLSVYASSHNTFEQFRAVQWLVFTPLALASLSDLCTSVSLCYFLYTSRTGVRQTDSVLNVLLLYLINAGVITAICNLACLATFWLVPNSTVFVLIFFISSKMYFASVLSTLNCRELIRAKSTNRSIPLPMIGRLGVPDNSRRAQDFLSTPQDAEEVVDIAINIDTQVEKRMECDDDRRSNKSSSASALGEPRFLYNQ